MKLSELSELLRSEIFEYYNSAIKINASPRFETYCKSITVYNKDYLLSYLMDRKKLEIYNINIDTYDYIAFSELDKSLLIMQSQEIKVLKAEIEKLKNPNNDKEKKPPFNPPITAKRSFEFVRGFECWNYGCEHHDEDKSENCTCDIYDIIYACKDQK